MSVLAKRGSSRSERHGGGGGGAAALCLHMPRFGYLSGIAEGEGGMGASSLQPSTVKHIRGWGSTFPGIEHMNAKSQLLLLTRLVFSCSLLKYLLVVPTVHRP